MEASSQQARAFPLLAEDPAKRPGVSTPPSCRPLTRPPCRLLTPHGAPHGSLAAALLPGSFSTVALPGRHGAEADHEGSTPPNLSPLALLSGRFGRGRTGLHVDRMPTFRPRHLSPSPRVARPPYLHVSRGRVGKVRKNLGWGGTGRAGRTTSILPTAHLHALTPPVSPLPRSPSPLPSSMTAKRCAHLFWRHCRRSSRT